VWDTPKINEKITVKIIGQISVNLRHRAKKWRDCVGIEPTGDDTRLPKGFEVRRRKIKRKITVKSAFPHGFVAKMHTVTVATPTVIL
jgi:hypothetical protein